MLVNIVQPYFLVVKILNAECIYNLWTEATSNLNSASGQLVCFYNLWTEANSLVWGCDVSPTMN